MGLRVNTNMASLNAQRNLMNTTNQLGRSMEKLSSGLRITRASDDAAGLAISEKFRAEIRSLSQAQRNANDAISLLQIAERVDLSIEVDLYEAKDFSKPGPAGCNMCGGIISESLVQILALEGIRLPPEVVQRGIDSYVLHTHEGTFRLETPLQELRIAAVHRGSGPRGSLPGEWISFDGFLLERAREMGARVIKDRIRGIELEGGKPVLTGSTVERKSYDLLVGAVGLHPKSLGLFEGLGFEYRPPATVKTWISEFRLGEERIREYFGSSMHVFLLDHPGLEFAAVIPKGSSATLCFLGQDLSDDFYREFVATPEVRDCFPPETDLEKPHCHCIPKMNIGEAVHPFADRVVLVGDSGASRLYKDGIGAAYKMAKAAAVTSIFSGISAEAFEEHYRPAYREIVNDNRFGKLLFQGVHLTQRHRSLRGGMLSMLSREGRLPKPKRTMSRVMWDTFTGSASYRDILIRFMNPFLLIRLLLETGKSFLRPSRRSPTGGRNAARP